jgi:serine/threonine-protein kinase
MSPSRKPPQRIGPFEVIDELGRGSNGAVYLARRDGVGEPCALKLLLHADSEGQARFDLEAAISGRLLHPLIVGAFESGTHERFKWIAMEYVEGETLQDRLVRGPLEPDEARLLFGDMAEALDFAHQRGVIHRDLKPANILIDQQGRARVTDFGLARTLNSNLTRAGDMIGTPYYMAPEQLQDPTGVDARADVYALGVMLYEALAGARPFEGTTIPEVTRAKRRGLYDPLAKVAPQVPSDLAQACERAMALDPDERLASAAELRGALRSGRARPAAGPPALASLAVVAALAVAVMVLVVAFARWRAIARVAAAEQALDASRAALAEGDLAAARASLDEALVAGVEAVTAEAAGPQALLEASERLEAGDPEPARVLLVAGPAPAGYDVPYRRLQDGVTLLDALGLADRAEVDPSWLLELGDRLLALTGHPRWEEARELLAQRGLSLASVLSRQRSPYERPLELLRLAERVATKESTVDAVRLERASYLFRRGRFQEASELAGSLARRPGRLGYQARYVDAFGQLWQERYKPALDALRGIWEDDPDGVVGLNAGAVFHSYSGMNDVGERLAVRSLELDPDYADAWISLTFCRNDLHRIVQQESGPELGARKLEEALEANKRAVALQPDHPRAWMARAFVLGNMGRAEGAVEAYSTGIVLTEPRPFARALRYRAKHLAQQGKLREAARDMSRALEQDPADVEALAWRGVFQDQLGRGKEAEEDWIRAIRADQRAFQSHVGRMPRPVIERIKAFFAGER